MAAVAFTALASGSNVAVSNSCHGWAAYAALCCCLLPVLAGFVLPVVVLIQRANGPQALSQMAPAAGTSFFLAVLTALLCVAVALFLAYGRRLMPGRIANMVSGMASFGYAVPGSVIAIAIIVPFTWVDNQLLSPLAGQLFGSAPTLWLSGSILILLFAYVVRFLAVSINTVEPGLQSITPSHDAAARSLGLSPMSCSGDCTFLYYEPASAPPP